ncbi:hypothetical protein, variant 1 [Batrachochytrium dendrobatidis JEL423]|uniref:TFIIF beta subunit N-terminal domain-containing protein n=1 Tax=Batrachochytrium dendrobatidis (strain JEL423) TaxID=403673 RepID=A0A177WUT2_BATDL|nr:hypothetical protein, variant 1 [Batrachochytrium dendrobatidis JEL423]
MEDDVSDVSDDEVKPGLSESVDVKSLAGDSDDEFSLDHQDNAVWLVKVPNFLAEKWMQIGFTHAGKDLGQVRIDKESTMQGNNPKVTLHIPDEPWSADLPKNYNLKFTNLAPKNEYVFTETSQGRAVGIAGIVQHEATVSPMVTDATHSAHYQRIMKKRTTTAATPSRVVKMIDENKTEHRRLMGSASSDTWNAGLEHIKVVLHNGWVLLLDFIFHALNCLNSIVCCHCNLLVMLMFLNYCYNRRLV